VNHHAATPVRKLWESIEARAWEAAGRRLADDFVCDWPQTGERFRGRDNFLAMNQAHPAPNWHIVVRRLIASGTQAAAEVVVTTDEAVDVCLGFYEVRDGRISHDVEYWTEHASQPTPSWRADWTEADALGR
jgi:ketosteroid isomerase-like protein